MDTQEPQTFAAPSSHERKSIAIANSLNRTNQIKVTQSNTIPSEISQNTFLNDAINAGLPKNYNFEIHKTIARIIQTQSKTVLFQFPEGLIRFGPIIVDILTAFFSSQNLPQVRCITMGDLTYGACCVDDYLAASLKCDLIIHYAHSCLVPINQLNSNVKYLYVFLDIKFNLEHLVNCVKHNFKSEQHTIALASTIQFVHSVHELARQLKNLSYKIVLPQSRPLSAGEVLGCTAPKLDSSVNRILFICDGRFHLEALMISNPKIEAYRYDPYSRKLTHESYNFEQMYQQRYDSIDQAVNCMKMKGTFGFVLGTLGRQGSEKVFNRLIEKLVANTECNYVKVMMPEVVQENLEAFDKSVDIWVQVACPRLSIDWGSFFEIALLNPYEFVQSINKFCGKNTTAGDNLNCKYPMDFYSKNSCGDHTPNHVCLGNPNCECKN